VIADRKGRAGLGLAVLAASLAGCSLLEPSPYDAMSEADVAAASRTVQRTLETAPDGDHVRWRDAASGNAGSVRPVRTFIAGNGRICRDYDETLSIAGATTSRRNTACRDDDGYWVWL
jgi:surface antigen